MSDQPTALRLADALQSDFDPDWMHEHGYDEIAIELRRLHALNAELVGALRQIANVNAMDHEYQQWAREALARVEASK
jgi:hypothetical protein